MTTPSLSVREDPWRDPEHLRRAAEDMARRQAEVADLLATYVRAVERASPDEAQMRHMLKFMIQVLGGIKASANQFADCCIVGQTRSDGVAWFASGVLVNPNVVLTANHIKSEGRQPDVVALPTDGELIPDDVIVPGRFIAHRSADIAVMVLERSVVSVDSIPMASSADVETAAEITVAGFGSNMIGRARMGRKLHADLDITSRSAQEFIAGRSGKGVCHGDSGGPAYIHADSQRVLAGITSRPAIKNGLCGEGAIFTRVDAHRDFIDQHF